MNNNLCKQHDIIDLKIEELLKDISIDKLVALSIEEKFNILQSLDNVKEKIKLIDSGMKKAIDQCYSALCNIALHESDKDYGTVHIKDGEYNIKYELPKKVTWDQKKLLEIAEKIQKSGDNLENYMDVKLSIPESKYSKWPSKLQQQFIDARCVETGKPSYLISIKK